MAKGAILPVQKAFPQARRESYLSGISGLDQDNRATRVQVPETSSEVVRC